MSYSLRRCWAGLARSRTDLPLALHSILLGPPAPPPLTPFPSPGFFNRDITGIWDGKFFHWTEHCPKHYKTFSILDSLGPKCQWHCSSLWQQKSNPLGVLRQSITVSNMEIFNQCVLHNSEHQAVLWHWLMWVNKKEFLSKHLGSLNATGDKNRVRQWRGNGWRVCFFWSDHKRPIHGGYIELSSHVKKEQPARG